MDGTRKPGKYIYSDSNISNKCVIKRKYNRLVIIMHQYDMLRGVLLHFFAVRI